MKCDPSSIGAVRSFCDSVSAASATNLRLLKDIEQTVTWLVALQSHAKGEAAFAERFRDAIASCAPVRIIDPDNAIRDIIVQAEERLEQTVSILAAKKQSAISDPKLKGVHEETVVSEYEQTINAIKMLHDGMVELRWAIMEHDADLEKTADKAYSSAEDLIKDLKS